MRRTVLGQIHISSLIDPNSVLMSTLRVFYVTS